MSFSIYNFPKAQVPVITMEAESKERALTLEEARLDRISTLSVIVPPCSRGNREVSSRKINPQQSESSNTTVNYLARASEKSPVRSRIT